MKRIVIIVLFLLSPVVLNAQSSTVKKGGKVAASGGLLVAPVVGKSVNVVNNQSVVSKEYLESLATRITQITWVPIVVSAEKRSDAGVVIYFEENESAPRMLIAPEDGWARLNLKKIMEDAKSEDIIKSRMKKEFWRVFSYVLGAGNAMMQPSLLGVLDSNEALDKCVQQEPWPEALNAIQQGAKAWKIPNARIVTYRRACQEGWAPSPKNDVQKAIWERVKAEQSEKPTKGLKIKYDPKVGR